MCATRVYVVQVGRKCRNQFFLHFVDMVMHVKEDVTGNPFYDVVFPLLYLISFG